jgi:ABC-type branched-subunit amino acid transport system substrate-binding protein
MNKNKAFIGLLVVIVLVFVGIEIFGQEDTPEDLHVGVISSLTGLVVGSDNLGEGYVNGIRLAHEEYMEANPDAKITLTIEDDGFDPKKGVSAYQKLVSVNKVDALLNLASPTIDAIKSDVHAAGIPVINTFVENTVEKDNIVQMYPDQSAIGILGDEANADGVQTVTAVIGQEQAYEKFINDFDEAFDGSLSIHRIPGTEVDLRSTALKVKEENADAVLVFMGPQNGAQLIKQLQVLEHKPSHLYFDISLQFGTEDYKNILGSLSYIENGEALYMPSNLNEAFAVKYEARFGMAPGIASGYGYDSFKVLIETYNEDAVMWNKNIHAYKASGATGDIVFNDLGLRPPEFVITTVKNGELVVE